METNYFKKAVLLLIFKRLDTTKQVLRAIRQVKPSHLYIACDGPRDQEQAEKVEAVRDYVVNAVDWDCEVKTLFREKNLGCRVAVSGAIDWFFEHEEEGIILEDDCVPHASFFPYVEELLNLYRDDKRIMCIAGNHFHGNAHQPSHSYFFSRYNHCWGWATWRRAWQYYDHDMNQWPKLRETDWLLTIGDGSRLFQSYWTRIFDKAYDKKVDSWAYRWTFSCWAQSGLTIKPFFNLVKNIGFDQEATHTKSSSQRHLFSKFPLESLSFPLLHPSNIVRNYEQDKWTDINHFKINWLKEVKIQLKRFAIVRLIWQNLRLIKLKQYSNENN